MTVGYHAPPRASASGVADYAWRLAGELRKHCHLAPNAAVANAHLYHLGNNQLHWDIYQSALARPGIILLHDANLHHLHLGALTETGYVAEFSRQYGAWCEGLARQLWHGRARSAADPAYFRYTMLKRVTDSAKAVIVHNQAAKERVTELSPQTPVEVIPHFTAPHQPPDAQTLARLRASLGLEAGHFAAGIFGYLRESKRLAPSLRAFQHAHRAAPNLRMLVAGGFGSGEYERAIEPLLQQPGVIRVPHQPREDDFRNLLYAADACISLRYPSCAESSGIAAHAMSASKPVLVTAGSEWAGFPAASLINLDAGPAEEPMLTQILIWLASHPHHARQIGERAQRHVLRHNRLEDIAVRIAGVLRKYSLPERP